MKKVLLSMLVVFGAVGANAQELSPELKNVNAFLNHLHSDCLSNSTADAIGLSNSCKRLHHNLRKVVTITPVELLYFAALLEVMSDESKPQSEREAASNAMLGFVLAKGQ